MRPIALLWIAIGAFLIGIYEFTLAQQTPRLSFDLDRIRSATVFIMQARNVSDNLIVTCVSSGTLVSRSGLILTNAHSTVTGRDCPGDTLIIALSIRHDEPPVPKYRAEVIQADPGLDLALLRIARQMDGRLIATDGLAFPFVELAESAQVQLDDTITIVGYPGIGNDPVSYEQGTVSGFMAEPSGGEKSWIKTSATIPGMMSGGGAYNRDGRLIGVPTTAPVTAAAVESDCHPIQDTNRDGLVNTNDISICVGGFINSLRPSSFARPLIRAASLGLSVETLTTGGIRLAPTQPPRFSRLFFSPSVVDGMPTSVISSLPAGANSLYLFFDYENMSPETVYELRVTINGIPSPIFSLAPVRWSGGERGMWYIGSSGQPWPNGVYEFTLIANGIASETQRLTIGGAAAAAPVFSNIVFGLQDAAGNIYGNGYVLPTGNIVSARFIYQNIPDGAEWREVWYYNGTEVRSNTASWSSGPSGAYFVSVQNSNGLPAGNYRLELYLQNNLAATADFAIAGAQLGASPQVFTDTHFVSASSPGEALSASPVGTFPNTIDSLYALFDWQQLTAGTLWTMRWLVDGSVFYQQTFPWGGSESGENYLIRLSGVNSIPDGTYQMDLLVNGVQLATVRAQVGIGQLPIDRFAQASGVQMRGQILDADTGKGIPGVTLILLSEDFSVEDFLWNQSQLFAQAVTDRNGLFQVDRPLQAGVPYSAVIATEGYLPITADGLEVNADTPNPLEMTIYLTRD